MKHPSPTEAAATLRDEFLALGWPRSAEVGHANDSYAANPALWAKTKRDAGELLGVWDPTKNAWRHPSCQFEADGTLRPRIRELLVALAQIPDYKPEADSSGWRRTFWLYGSSYSLAGADGAPRTPADVFADDPDSVIQLARSAAHLDPNSCW